MTPVDIDAEGVRALVAARFTADNALTVSPDRVKPRYGKGNFVGMTVETGVDPRDTPNSYGIRALQEIVATARGASPGDVRFVIGGERDSIALQGATILAAC